MQLVEMKSVNPGMDMNNLDKIFESVRYINQQIFQVWYTQILFSWRWWLQIALTFLPWLFWIKYREKKYTIRLLFIGFIVAIITGCLDNIGMCYNLWHYDWKVFPFVPLFIPWDFTLFPTEMIFLLQIKPKMNPFVKAIIFAVTTAFIAEPLFTWIGIYHPIRWKYFYSFFIYILLYLAADYIYNRKALKDCSTTSFKE